MYAYQLLARLKYLILLGQKDGDLEWTGTFQDYQKMVAEEEFHKIWK